MRPRRLRLKGFTAFRDEQEIDFATLDLFAIAGPTGAGKSSLLDAMTYALYGWVERVGNQVSQLISQGMPSMAVELEFAIGADSYRVGRRTARPGAKLPAATKVVLERLEAGAWVALASGVREADERVRELIGLDYDGFTRAVLLPQGKFDQFLSGKPEERRRILSDLLDLHLYVRMQKHALGMAKSARDERAFIQGQLDSDYRDVDEAALARERAHTNELRGRETALLAAQRAVREVVDRRNAARRAANDLRGCAAEARDLARGATSSARSLTDLATQLARAERAATDANATAREAAKAAKAARDAHARALERWGGVKELAALRTKAEQLADLRRRVAEVEALLAGAAEREPALKRELAAAARAVAAARAAEGEAKSAFGAAQRDLERAQHDEALAVVAHGLRKGDPCPVCGKPLSAAPAAAKPASLDRAKAKLDRAERAHADAQERRRRSEDEHKEAAREITALAAQASQAREALEQERRRAALTERALRPAFAARLPDDPAGALVERIEEVEGLASVATRSEREGAALRDAAATAEQTRTALAGSVEAEKARLPLAAAAALATRAAQLARPAQLPAVGAKPPSDGGGAGLAAFATELAAALARFAEAIARVADERAGSDATFVAEAGAAVDDLVPPQRELDALASSVEDAVRAAAGDIRAGEERASRLEDQLRRKAELVAKAASLASRADVYQALSHELQANAIVDFVQAEALTALAAEGTKRLQYLSDGRYRLRYREDEFFVVDRVNGDEERSVRTLSGGESFLASLALALTLSEQIRALATTERARLDSLFLDEGFGTLDPETLSAVIAGIARLGVDGRLVGVISHVRELTDQFPRIEVEKSQRGSRTKVVV